MLSSHQQEKQAADYMSLPSQRQTSFNMFSELTSNVSSNLETLRASADPWAPERSFGLA